MSALERVRRGGSGGALNLLTSLGPLPRHQLVEAIIRPEIDKAGEHVGDVSLGVDAAQFAGLDQCGKDRIR